MSFMIHNSSLVCMVGITYVYIDTSKFHKERRSRDTLIRF